MQHEKPGARTGTSTAIETARTSLLHEVLGPGSKAAVVVIDMQNDFCASTGAFANAGIDISANSRIVQPADAFVKTMRKAGAKIVWIKQAISPNHMSPAAMRRLRRAPERLELCKPGTPGFDLVEGLEVFPEDSIVEKFRYSAFLGSSLDQILRSCDIQTVVLIGTAANGCVDSTARDAAQLDYDVVIAGDLTGHSDPTLAAASLKNLDRHFALVCTSDEIAGAVTA